MQTFLQDLHYGLRSLAKNPSFAAVAILTLALGVGANTAIFSVLQAVVLRDLPYHEPDRIAVLWTKNLQQNLPDGTSYLNFRDWKAQSRELPQMAAYVRPEFTRGTMTLAGESERFNLGVVGPGFFELLGVAPLIGRTFDAADFKQRFDTVVISQALWRQRFGGDPQVVGKTVQVEGANVRIIGVMPQGFEIPTAEVQLWAPLFFGPAMSDPRNRTDDGFIVLGRLSPTATAASARTEMDTIAARLRAQYPDTNGSFGVTTDPLFDRVIGSTTQRSLWLLWGSVGFVLLIACVNVANLSLARVAVRRNEFSLRTALGASKTRLARQILTEKLVLALAGGAIGLLLAWLGTIALRTWAAGVLPRADTIRLDGRVFLLALAASLGCGLLAGLLPAMQLSVSQPASALREGGPRSLGGRGERRLYQALVVIELALAVMLLSGAGLLIRSFARVQSADRGFDSHNVLLLQFDLTNSWFERDKRTAFFTEALQRVRSLPGVVAAGAISDFFIRRQPDYRVALEGDPPKRDTDPAPPLTEDFVLPGYFEAMRIPLLRGRLLNDSDVPANAPPVIVINEEMAKRFWPGQDPIGKRLKYGLNPDRPLPWKTVVGVVANMRRQRLDEPAIPYMFQPGAGIDMDIAVRTVGDPEALRNAIRAEMRAMDPNIPPYGVMTVEQRLSQTVALRRLQTLLLGALAGVALLLSVIGAYGIIHRSVAARTQEIGIRMALGADRTSVLRMVLLGGLAIAVVGLALGLAGSMALSRTISSFLYETNPLDPLTYIAVAVVLIAVTTAACLAPARRASRVDPISALRDE
jgi:predicted permease